MLRMLKKAWKGLNWMVVPSELIIQSQKGHIHPHQENIWDAQISDHVVSVVADVDDVHIQDHGLDHHVIDETYKGLIFVAR